MNFPSATWRFRDREGRDGYLFVESDSGRIVSVTYRSIGRKGYRHVGYGLWFHEFADFEIVTTHIKISGQNEWLHEYYRINGKWMQWSNKRANIFHDLVGDCDVPDGFQAECRRILKRSAGIKRPDYDPECLALE